jgi:hypothetical protein
VRSGPMAAPAEFVERTMRPVPRMRQRGSWRIRLERLGRPVSVLAGAALAIALVVAGFGMLMSRSGPGTSPTPTADRSRPTFQLDLAGSRVGAYRDDPAAPTATCRQAGDGSWRLLYGGGDPYVTLDLLVVPRTDATPSVAAEIMAGPTYVRFDPDLVRGGDPAGRSEASVEIRPGPGATTFVVQATTPDRTSGTDGAPVEVQLTAICPDRP